MIELVLAILLSLFISALCSLFESTLLSISITDIAKISEKKPKIANILKKFKENIQKPISVILIINTLAHTIGASIAGSQFDKLFGDKWIFLFAFFYSFVMIQWTEILPKTIGVNNNKFLAKIIAKPLQILVIIFTPIVYFVQILNKPFEINNKNQFNAIEDIAILTRFASINNLISKDQEKILSQTINLQRTIVKDIMIKKNEIKYLSTDMSLMDAVIEAHIHHHTRLPLVQGNDINNIIGYVNFKDIVSALQINPKDPSLTGICRPIISINENDNLAITLNKLTKSYQHIAIVKNDNNEVTGLITLEDIIEAIVGNINEDFEQLPAYFYQIAENRYLAGAGISIQTLREKMNLNLPDIKGNLGEWLCQLFDKTPKIEETFKFNNYNFIIRKVRRSQIHEVIIEIL